MNVQLFFVLNILKNKLLKIPKGFNNYEILSQFNSLVVINNKFDIIFYCTQEC